MKKHIFSLLLCAALSASHAQNNAFAPSLISLAASPQSAELPILKGLNIFKKQKKSAQAADNAKGWLGIEATGIYFAPVMSDLEVHLASYNRIFQDDLTKGFTPLQARGGFSAGFTFVHPSVCFSLGYLQYAAHTEATFFSGFKREIDLKQQGIYLSVGGGFWNHSLPERLHIFATISIANHFGQLNSGTRYPDGSLSYTWTYQNRFNARYILPWDARFGLGMSVYYKIGNHFMLTFQSEYLGIIKLSSAPSVSGPIDPLGSENLYGPNSSFSTIYYSPNKYMLREITTPEGRGIGTVSASQQEGIMLRLGCGFIF